MLEGLTYQSIPKPPIPPGQYPKHLTGVLLQTVGNLTQNEVRPVGHLILCQNVLALQAKGFFKILSTLSMCTVFTGHCSYIHCFVGAFDSLWKSPGFLEWTILLEWTNLFKTAFQDLKIFRLCLVGHLHFNKWFDEREICWIVTAGWGTWRFLKH